MKTKLTVLCTLLLAGVAQAMEISPAEAASVGQRVWKNECEGTVEGLVSWNDGENFPSLGIGHFIWYPAGKRGPFEESFPMLVALLRERGKPVPAWLRGPAPWPTAAAMRRDSQRVSELRAVLAGSIAIQTQFLINRVEAALPKMLEAAGPGERGAIRKRFKAVAETSEGDFALVDYVNFKGEGVLSTERYHGRGWGLLQVLEGMRDAGEPVRDFSDSAKRVLARRVQNAPTQRHEAQWLPGWQARVERYAKR